MTVTSANMASFGYTAPTTLESHTTIEREEAKRNAYGTSLLPKLDQTAYDAFVNATHHFTPEEKTLAAQILERAAAHSAAMQYAQSNDIELTSDLAVIYNFFEHYHDTVSTPQIKHLLNTKLFSTQDPQEDRFIRDYLAQLGGARALDIRI